MSFVNIMSKSLSAQFDEPYKHTHASVHTCVAPSCNKMSALLEKHLQKLSLYKPQAPQVSKCFARERESKVKIKRLINRSKFSRHVLQLLMVVCVSQCSHTEVCDIMMCHCMQSK